jgi:hypothetical protein
MELSTPKLLIGGNMQLAIDPGTARTGIVLMDGYRPVSTNIVNAEHIRETVFDLLDGVNVLLIEKPV